MKSLSLSTPHVIVMMGIPGSGKTRFALQFSKTFSAPFINDQPLRLISSDPSQGEAMALDILAEVMKTKHTILFEGATGRKTVRTELSRLAKLNGYKVLFVWVQTAVDTARQRTVKYLTREEYDQQLKDFLPPDEGENYIVISGHHTHTTQARTILTRLTESHSTTDKERAPISGVRSTVRSSR
ncbi:hypothetical protein B7Z17_00440 [Candidatus Saccharibacteria bacterium 32-49-10]|nr:MAG: hypothetical protein B7Z17_00440 [Candidatus Saccharibacteria bacterium 32-49-10]